MENQIKNRTGDETEKRLRRGNITWRKEKSKTQKKKTETKHERKR
jgi:hypothetical protein